MKMIRQEDSTKTIYLQALLDAPSSLMVYDRYTEKYMINDSLMSELIETR